MPRPPLPSPLLSVLCFNVQASSFAACFYPAWNDLPAECQTAASHVSAADTPPPLLNCPTAPPLLNTKKPAELPATLFDGPNPKCQTLKSPLAFALRRPPHQVTRRAGVLLHSDACLGGFVLPFAARLGHPVPRFDFSVPGVTSMSVDTHKFGMAHKGTSVVLYHSPALRKHQYTSITEWTGGLYISPGVFGGGGVGGGKRGRELVGNRVSWRVKRLLGCCMSSWRNWARGFDAADACRLHLPKLPAICGRAWWGKVVASQETDGVLYVVLEKLAGQKCS